MYFTILESLGKALELQCATGTSFDVNIVKIRKSAELYYQQEPASGEEGRVGWMDR